MYMKPKAVAATTTTRGRNVKVARQPHLPWPGLHCPNYLLTCRAVRGKPRALAGSLTVSCGLQLNSSLSILKLLETNLKSVKLWSPA